MALMRGNTVPDSVHVADLASLSFTAEPIAFFNEHSLVVVSYVNAKRGE